MRDQIIQTARTYLHTPFHWKARLKGVGIDCAGLPICVGRSINLFPPDFDLTEYGNYPRNMLETLRAHCTERLIDEREPGDILCLRIQNEPQHAGIMTDIGIIHACMRRGVIEHVLDEEWCDRIVGVFKFPGVD